MKNELAQRGAVLLAAVLALMSTGQWLEVGHSHASGQDLAVDASCTYCVSGAVGETLAPSLKQAWQAAPEVREDGAPVFVSQLTGRPSRIGLGARAPPVVAF